MSMDGELTIGKLSETNLYFKLSPYLLLGKAPSEWLLPNNLIRNLISWLNSLSSNKYSFEHQYIACFDGAVQYEYLHIKCSLDICATKLFGPCCLPIFGAITIPQPPGTLSPWLSIRGWKITQNAVYFRVFWSTRTLHYFPVSSSSPVHSFVRQRRDISTFLDNLMAVTMKIIYFLNA